ncbi:PASTA domain-containing protein [Mycobacterium interjectum]|uniref:PASTA domain-containing protein n=1 Tax=Mycobacterium interjectum TaxID=33895 RepID=UPI0011555E64|nr:PASTA domain-containing protein [Mycobacterium interjectum]MCV7090038.1 PASTA domain-containing protein [Mycobacterium interjectum]
MGVAWQSPCERWLDLDDRPGGGEVERAAASTVLAHAAGHLIEIRARERHRGPTVIVPNVLGLEWNEVRNVDNGLVAINAEPDSPTVPGNQHWIVSNKSPEPGAWVDAGPPIRLWLNGDGGPGVREPRRPQPNRYRLRGSPVSSCLSSFRVGSF